MDGDQLTFKGKLFLDENLKQPFSFEAAIRAIRATGVPIGRDQYQFTKLKTTKSTLTTGNINERYYIAEVSGNPERDGYGYKWKTEFDASGLLYGVAQHKLLKEAGIEINLAMLRKPELEMEQAKQAMEIKLAKQAVEIEQIKREMQAIKIQLANQAMEINAPKHEKSVVGNRPGNALSPWR